MGALCGALLGLLLLLLLMVLDEALADRVVLESGDRVRVTGSWLSLLVIQLVPIGALVGAGVGFLIPARNLAGGAIASALSCVLAWELLGFWF